MKPSNYFADAEREVNQTYLSAAGEWEHTDAEWDGAFGDELNADATAPATPVATGATGGKSQPYTIVLANTTTDNISNVVILDAALRASNFAVSGVSFSYEPTTLTYGQFLSGIAGRPFKVGLLRLIASNASASIVAQQLLASLTIETKNPNGNLIQMPFIPEFDSYQYSQTQVDITYAFNVDTLTKITFSTLYASTTLKVRLYPSVTINNFAQLKGTSGAIRSNSPQVNKALTK